MAKRPSSSIHMVRNGFLDGRPNSMIIYIYGQEDLLSGVSWTTWSSVDPGRVVYRVQQGTALSGNKYIGLESRYYSLGAQPARFQTSTWAIENLTDWKNTSERLTGLDVNFMHLVITPRPIEDLIYEISYSENASGNTTTELHYHWISICSWQENRDFEFHT